ncbi:conserved hypothetical protein [Leishmania major strain Friedlin]|uniref:Uncharacterized protein n=1 Tax=Leishmania major TaxID=5664 RepID=Q4QHQ5_LEIMA|nr:conserved hypothetical protein [Leishmania major strain Friedlin]CAG9569736.1 hypothetical_protein_-__conserved [Leishmania major strain Friedlin]CAJ02943.1 conserved hypothetical protein [Leishmania major strain Friedlin]|eukprot:XP_001681293.1 conserved hypothetical protein [Leishmania major strain Friedlin]
MRCAEQQPAPHGTESPSASPKVTEDSAEASSNTDALRRGRQQRTSSPCPTPTSKAQMTRMAVRQRFQQLLKRSNASVQALYRATRKTDVILSSTTSKATRTAPAAPTSFACVADIDAADVFWALVLYMSAALCWRQRRFLAAPRRADACVEDVVSSSRDTSERHSLQPHISSQPSRQESAHSSLSSTADYFTGHTPRDTAARHGAGGGAEADFSAALRSHYALGKAAADNTPLSRCRRVLERLLPLLESRLSEAQLWRQPSLLAALDVLARGFAMAEDLVHALSSPSDMGTAARCPLCYAAALDNELAVEAFLHLRCYAAAYQGAEDVAEDAGAQHGRQRRETRNGFDRAELIPGDVGWVAACRIALWNNCRASLMRLCCPPLFCTAMWWPHHQEACERAGCRRYAVLEALWISWWRAEAWLASGPSSPEITSTRVVISRDAAARWRSALLFMQVVLPAAEAAAREPGAEDSGVEDGAAEKHPNSQRANHRALLAHLVQLPIVTERIHTAGTRNCGASGTVFHWLSQQGDVPLLTLLCRTLDGCTAAITAGKAPVGRPVAAAEAAAGHAGRAYIIHLGAAHARGEGVGDDRRHRATLPAPEAAESGAVASIGGPVSQPAPTYPGRGLCSSVSSVWGLHLMDTLGQNALDVACRHQHLPCVRLLLQAGLSPNSLTTLVSDKCVDSLPLPLLRLLYDPSLLEGADGSRGAPHMGLAERLRQPTCPAAAASRTLAQLAFRLWTEKVQQLSMVPQAADGEAFALDQWLSAYTRCQAAQDRVLRPAMAALEFDAYEPVARLVVLSVLTRKLNDWLATAPSSVRFGASDLPVGTSGSVRGDAASSRSSPTVSQLQPAPPSLRQLRLQHTVALRLYTQLTCPLGRALLRRAVDARCAVCDALAAREDRAASVLLAASAVMSAPSTAEAVSVGDEVAKRDVAVVTPEASVPVPPGASSLALSEPVKSRQELQGLYERELADAHKLDARLVAEHQQRMCAMEARGGSEGDYRHRGTHPRHLRASLVAAHGVATVLRGRHHEHHTCARRHSHRSGSGHDGEACALYALAVIPSAEALQSARWETSANRCTVEQPRPQRTTAGVRHVVEPTLWTFTSAPQQVWLRLPDGVDLDRLLRENDGGGFGVIADDMPLTAPVQRGDLVTFRCSSGRDGAGGSGGISARVAQQQQQQQGARAEERRHSPQFVVQQIFSERRTLPYLVWKSATAEDKDLQHQPPPASLVLPYAVAAGTPAWTLPHRAAPRSTSGATDPRQDSITLHACCLAVSYVARMTSAQLHDRHPLDWLLQTRRAANFSPSASESGSTDVLTTLQWSAEWTARWAQTVWAGHQPCWLEERMRTTNDSSGASQGHGDSSRECGTHSSSRSPGCCTANGGRDVVHFTDPFCTFDDADAADGRDSFAVDGGRRSLHVLRTLMSGGTAPHEAQKLSAEVDWPSRAEGCSAVVTADVVLGSATVV